MGRSGVTDLWHLRRVAAVTALILVAFVGAMALFQVGRESERERERE